MSGVNQPYRYQYEHVGASATNQVLGGTGAKGDYIHRLVCTVSTAATAAVSIVDGSLALHTILPNSPGNDGIGVYTVDIEAISANGPWKINTGAGVEVMAVGIFSA